MTPTSELGPKKRNPNYKELHREKEESTCRNARSRKSEKDGTGMKEGKYRAREEERIVLEEERRKARRLRESWKT